MTEPAASGTIGACDVESGFRLISASVGDDIADMIAYSRAVSFPLKADLSGASICGILA
jgi:hypothetical protein